MKFSILSLIKARKVDCPLLIGKAGVFKKTVVRSWWMIQGYWDANRRHLLMMFPMFFRSFVFTLSGWNELNLLLLKKSFCQANINYKKTPQIDRSDQPIFKFRGFSSPERCFCLIKIWSQTFRWQNSIIQRCASYNSYTNLDGPWSVVDANLHFTRLFCTNFLKLKGKMLHPFGITLTPSLKYVWKKYPQKQNLKKYPKWHQDPWGSYS